MTIISKKMISLLLTLTLLVTVTAIGMTALSASAESGTTKKVTLRIEGIKSNLFYKTESVPYTGTLTLQAALKYIDQQEDGIAITGIDSNFISDINGESSAKFGGWDGWLYKVDGSDISVGIDSFDLKDGDSILIYYGDPYGVGMQFPTADTSKLTDGILKFTSSDTTYDANGNASTAVNPVAGATVTWNYGNSSAKYTTDANGEIKIEPAQLTEGAHGVQISKTNEAGLPLVLRFAPDYTITVNASETQTSTSASASSTTMASSSTTVKSGTTATQTEASITAAQTTASDDETASPKTGDDLTIYFIMLTAALTSVILTVRKGRIRTYEK